MKVSWCYLPFFPRELLCFGMCHSRAFRVHSHTQTHDCTCLQFPFDPCFLLVFCSGSVLSTWMAVVLTSLTVQSLVTERWAVDLAGVHPGGCSLLVAIRDVVEH